MSEISKQEPFLTQRAQQGSAATAGVHNVQCLLSRFSENGSPHHSISLTEMSLVLEKPTRESFYMEVIIRNK